MGKITANGADLLLSWDVDYFLKLCLLLYGQTAATANLPITWDQISTRLDPVCQPAIDYVNQVMALGQ